MQRLKVWCVGSLIETIYDYKRNSWILPAQGGLLVGQGGQHNFSIIHEET